MRVSGVSKNPSIMSVLPLVGLHKFFTIRKTQKINCELMSIHCITQHICNTFNTQLINSSKTYIHIYIYKKNKNIPQQQILMETSNIDIDGNKK